MIERTDQELLSDYATDRSEMAFSMLVRRHIDLVYSAALRLVRDAHLAEDVTQAVFSAAAREAAKLQHYTVFSAWLHRTTRNQATLVVRSEVRRRHRETAAASMNQATSEDDIDWDQLAPHLDEALDQLGKDDREALLLRFFERKTAREIGHRLGLGDEAAQKRVCRALDRLRALLAEKGVTTSAAAFGVLLSAKAVHAAPPALSLAVATASISIGTSIPTILTIMASTKIKTAVIGLVTAGLATTVMIQQQTIGRLREDLARPVASAPPQIQQPAPNTEELERLRAEHSELLRLRGEVTLLRQQARERAASPQKTSLAPTPVPPPGPDFVPIENWADAGHDTPRNAFHSFLAALKTGDPERIDSTVHWEVTWNDEITEADRALVAKTRQDYLQMLQRVPQRISGFELAPIEDNSIERTRVFFQTRLTDGTPRSSSFEMAKIDGQWRPVIRMGWDRASQFSTSAIFGPSVDLEP